MDTYKTRALDLILSRITQFHNMATAPDGTEDSHIYGGSACDALLELHTDLAAEPDDEPIDPTEGQKFAALMAALTSSSPNSASSLPITSWLGRGGFCEPSAL